MSGSDLKNDEENMKSLANSMTIQQSYFCWYSGDMCNYYHSIQHHLKFRITNSSMKENDDHMND